MLPTIEAHFALWMGLGLAVGLQWLMRFLMLGLEHRRRIVLTSRSHRGLPAALPRLSMLVAAKDEQENIEACARSLLEQDYPDLEVIVIDDRSDDETPKILRRLSREYATAKKGSNPLRQRVRPLFRVISILNLEQGWFGKNNAMREGVAASDGDWLCFTDADCRQISNRSLTVAMQEALAHDVDFLTVTPVLEMNTLWEKLTQPACAQTLLFWFQPRRVHDPRRTTAYANGAFILMRRDCYERIGGHERVKTEVNEDIQMARFAKAAGLKLRMVENDDLYRTRMYGSIGDSWRGWSRIFFGSLKSTWRLAFSAFAGGLFTVLPPVFLVLSLLGRTQASSQTITGWNWSVAVWSVVVLACQAAAWRFYGFLKINRLWSLTYIFGAAVTVGMLLNALLKQIGMAQTTWRGTTYLGDQRVDPAPSVSRTA